MHWVAHLCGYFLMLTHSSELLLWCFTTSPFVSKSDIPSTISNLIFATPASFRQSRFSDDLSSIAKQTKVPTSCTFPYYPKQVCISYKHVYIFFYWWRTKLHTCL